MILLQLICNAILLWLVYYWLGIGEGTAGDLLWSALVALAIAGAACWLHGAAFDYFGESRRKLLPAMRRTVRNVPALLAAMVALTGVYLLLSVIGGWSPRPAFRIASYLTLELRKPVRPSTVELWFTVALWLVKWMAVPVLALPMLAGIASHGWAGFREFGWRARRWWYWLATPVLATLALWVPFKLYDWVPRTASFGMEMTSFVLRIAAGYLLFLAAWLALVFLTSSGKPRLTQSSTAVSP